MKNFFLILVLSSIVKSGVSQFPGIEIWDRRFGGTGEDDLGAFLQSRNGGYLLVGCSNSGISGDKSQTSYGDFDYWVVAIDSNGRKMWDKDYGGDGFDALNYAALTRDGGYILGGYSSSGISGDKTQNCWGDYDYWLVKIDSVGNKQWDRRYGGTYRELLFGLQQTRDGGYVFSGVSNSGLSGDKTQDNWDTTYSTNDIWVVKIDSVGDKQWDRRFGSSSTEGGGSILQTNDGGYIVVGATSSDSISDDVTQPTFRGYDYWVVKIDSAGTKQWDKRYGGDGWDFCEVALTTSDGGYLLGGYSSSDSSGKKSQSTCGDYDYWILKIDSVGNKLWDRDFGGSGTEQLYTMTGTLDKGYLLSGWSGSHITCDKSEYAAAQSWLIKTDSLGLKQWDKTIFTDGFDTKGFAIQTSDGCYIIAEPTASGVGGYKTQPNWDPNDSSTDYWIVKFCYTGTPENVESLSDKLQVNIYPNPFSSELAVLIAQQNLRHASFTISNVLGQVEYTQNETNLSDIYTKMLDLSYLPNGVYFVEVVVDGICTTKEIVKQ